MDNFDLENKTETPEAPKQTASVGGKLIESDGKLKKPFPILAVAFVGATVLDLLLFNQTWGWHWALAVNVYLIAVVVSAKLEGLRIPLPSVTLMVLTSLSALLTGFRSASYTSGALTLFSGLGMLLLTASLRNGQWMQFRLRELIVELFKLIPSGLIGIPALILEGIQQTQVGKEQDPSKKKTGLAILRGVLITIPLLLIFGLLLASADTIFSELLSSAFKWIRTDFFDDILQHAMIILLLTWLSAAALWHALAKSGEQLAIEPDQPLFKPFLGMTETTIVLVSLNLLFATFLAVQFRYFFAGSANVSIDGFTYAEYARRGFFELVAVALIAGALYFGLASFTKRATDGKKRLFSVLAGLLLAQVGVMLVSAFQRLRLYEQAYGFTSTRLAAHVFMVFIGLLLLAMVIMELKNAFRRLGLVMVLGLLAFALVMVGINEDALIATQNIERAIEGEELDADYLVYSLSNDAVPALFRYMDDPQLDPALQKKLQLVMACRALKFENTYGDASWQSITIPTLVAGKLYEAHKEALSSQSFSTINDDYSVVIDGVSIWCGSYSDF